MFFAARRRLRRVRWKLLSGNRSARRRRGNFFYAPDNRVRDGIRIVALLVFNSAGSLFRLVGVDCLAIFQMDDIGQRWPDEPAYQQDEAIVWRDKCAHLGAFYGCGSLVRR